MRIEWLYTYVLELQEVVDRKKKNHLALPQQINSFLWSNKWHM